MRLFPFRPAGGNRKSREYGFPLPQADKPLCPEQSRHKNPPGSGWRSSWNLSGRLNPRLTPASGLPCPPRRSGRYAVRPWRYAIMPVTRIQKAIRLQALRVFPPANGMAAPCAAIISLHCLIRMPRTPVQKNRHAWCHARRRRSELHPVPGGRSASPARELPFRLPSACDSGSGLA
jgi:hypothetical protein